MTAAEAAARLGQAGALIAELRRSLSRSPDIDLVPLLGAVENACHVVATLPAAEVRALLPQVVALLDDVESLERALEAAHTSTGDELGDLARAQHASAAYGRKPRRP